MAKVPIDAQDAPQAARRPLMAITGLDAHGDGRVTLQLTFDADAVSAIFRALDLGGGSKGSPKPRQRRNTAEGGRQNAEPRVKRAARKKPPAKGLLAALPAILGFTQ